MRTLILTILSLAVTTSAYGGVSWVFGTAGEGGFTNVPPPVNLSWELATAADQRVGMHITVTERIVDGSQQYWDMTTENAASYMTDFAAWQAAVNDPAFTRSIITFGAESNEIPLVRRDVPVTRTGPMVLDLVRVLLNNYGDPAWFSGFRPSIYSAASDHDPVPEPDTFKWSLILLCAVSIHRWRATTGGRR